MYQVYCIVIDSLYLYLYQYISLYIGSYKLGYTLTTHNHHRKKIEEILELECQKIEHN
jgi:hypothetical protein